MICYSGVREISIRVEAKKEWCYWYMGSETKKCIKLERAKQKHRRNQIQAGIRTDSKKQGYATPTDKKEIREEIEVLVAKKVCTTPEVVRLDAKLACFLFSLCGYGHL